MKTSASNHRIKKRELRKDCTHRQREVKNATNVLKKDILLFFFCFSYVTTDNGTHMSKKWRQRNNKNKQLKIPYSIIKSQTLNFFRVQRRKTQEGHAYTHSLTHIYSIHSVKDRKKRYRSSEKKTMPTEAQQR